MLFEHPIRFKLSSDKAMGITAGAFDLLHAGHLLMLKEAKDNCDFLIVCLQSNPAIDRPLSKTPPIESIFERYRRLASCAHVDYIIPYDTEEDLLTILKHTSYKWRFLDENYRGKEFTGWNYRPEAHFFNERSHSYSSTSLKERIQKNVRDS